MPMFTYTLEMQQRGGAGLPALPCLPPFPPGKGRREAVQLVRVPLEEVFSCVVVERQECRVMLMENFLSSQREGHHTGQPHSFLFSTTKNACANAASPLLPS